MQTIMQFTSIHSPKASDLPRARRAIRHEKDHDRTEHRGESWFPYTASPRGPAAQAQRPCGDSAYSMRMFRECGFPSREI